MNAIYLKNGLGEKLYLTEELGVDVEPDKLKLNIKGEDWAFYEVESFIKDVAFLTGIIIYSSIVQEDGRETDEYILQEFPDFTQLHALGYNLDTEVYTAEMIIPDYVEQRLDALEEKVAEKPALISPYTENHEPDGIASRFYDRDELIVIYDENDLPITVKVTLPIGYWQFITVGVNVEKYYGA